MMRAVFSKQPVHNPTSSAFKQLVHGKFLQHQAFDATFDPDELAEARKWRESFNVKTLPKGRTTYSRSSGAGGQHVNKTETKATTVWPVADILQNLPKLLRPGLRTSRYYTKSNDSITMQAQTERDRRLNAEENQQKLFNELTRIYKERVPGETDPAKRNKYEAVTKSFQEARLKSKKHQSSKKASRRGGGFD